MHGQAVRPPTFVPPPAPSTAGASLMGIETDEVPKRFVLAAMMRCSKGCGGGMGARDTWHAWPPPAGRHDSPCSVQQPRSAPGSQRMPLERQMLRGERGIGREGAHELRRRAAEGKGCRWQRQGWPFPGLCTHGMRCMVSAALPPCANSPATASQPSGTPTNRWLHCARFCGRGGQGHRGGAGWQGWSQQDGLGWQGSLDSSFCQQEWPTPPEPPGGTRLAGRPKAAPAASPAGARRP